MSGLRFKQPHAIFQAVGTVYFAERGLRPRLLSHHGGMLPLWIVLLPPLLKKLLVLRNRMLPTKEGIVDDCSRGARTATYGTWGENGFSHGCSTQGVVGVQLE